MSDKLDPEIKHRKLITVVSITVPLVVAALFVIRIPNVGPFLFLPPIYASINALTAVLLVLAVLAIKNGKRKFHEGLMKTCMFLTSSFLVMYITYHMTSDSTVFGDINGDGKLSITEADLVEGSRLIYVIILLSHILLSVLVLPLVLITFSRGLSQSFVKHKKIARWAFPIWLYVAVTGVIVYLMISPYY
jgi:putative membrane protein